MQINIEKKTDKTFYSQVLVIIISILSALFFIAILLLLLGHNPIEVYKELFSSAFLTGWGIVDTTIKSIPLLLIALGLSIAFKMELWNIGGEGQFYLGAIAATWIAVFLFPELNSWLLIPLILISGFIAGAILGAIVGVLKAYLGVNEIVSTLMFNYIAIYLSDFLVYGHWRDPEGYNFPMTKAFSEQARLPKLFNTNIHFGLIFGLILALLVYYYINKTTNGFEMKIIGDSERTARYAGINVKKNIVLALLISGGIAGFAGAVQMAGVQYQLQHGFSPGYGYTAIIVAWLGKLNPLAIILVSFIMGGLLVGGEQIQLFLHIPLSIVNVLQASILFFLLAGEVLNNYKISISFNSELKVKDGDNPGI